MALLGLERRGSNNALLLLEPWQEGRQEGFWAEVAANCRLSH